ncbi:DNA polymerase III subunit chi [Candidatus Endolissoclinum faulkneri]|nr:DNA polymerase III subunit chi [Candidatus Endolissoclinum faulkneri]
MTEIIFYHLTSITVNKALPKLLCKTLAARERAIVLLASAEKVQALDYHLWVYDERSWLPHGAQKYDNANLQPIWLTHRNENPNGARFLFIIERVEAFDLSSFKRVFDLFDGHNHKSIAAARLRWKLARDAGHVITYWRQKNNGSWLKIA